MTAMMAFMIGGTVFLQLYAINSALKYSVPVIVLPLFFTVYTCFSLANTVVYFDKLQSTAWNEMLLLLGGMAFIITGVWTLRQAET
jgi:putative Ca2+/H+ antiporter (TMEM165/GDT1 family)